MTKKMFITLLMLLFASSTHAQDQNKGYHNFNIQSFQWIDEKEVALYLGSSGNTNLQHNEDINPYYSDFNFYNSNSNYSNFDIGSTFRLKRKTWQSELILELPIHFSYHYQDYTHSSSNYTDVSRDYSLNLSPVSTTYPYTILNTLKYTRYFSGIFVGAQMLPSINLTRHEDVSYSRNYATDGFLRFGIGRIQPGTHAYQAMQLISEMKENQYLTQDVTQQDMQQLSRIIATERNKYWFDWRTQKIDAVNNIIVFLRSKGYLVSDAPKIFLMIHDIYNYIDTTDRNFGFEAYLKLGGYYNFTDSETLYNYNYQHARRIQSHFLFGAQFDYAYPIDHYWHFDFNGHVNVLLQKNNSSDSNDRNNQTNLTSSRTEETKENYILDPSIHATITYFPSTRWKVSLSESLYFQSSTLSKKTPSESYSYDTWKISNSISLQGSFQMNNNLDIIFSFSWYHSYHQQQGHTGSYSTYPNNEYVYHAPDQSTRTQFLNAYFSIQYRLF